MLSQENEKKYLYEDIVNHFEIDASNRIEIKKISEQYSLYVNGHLIGQSPFESLFGNGIIITCGSNLSVQLSRFTIARLVKPKEEINLPPRLSIESPELNDSEIYETEEDEIHIDGIVSDENGVRSLTINGLNTSLQNQRFNLDLSLVKGRNVIKIIATDNTGNQSVKHFEVIRREPVENFIAGQRRLAVVIGNNNYQNAPKLKNPVNDAVDMSTTLKALGFDVREYHNLTYSELIQAVRDYGDAINDYDVTMFFYAGHGMQVDDQNYLIPIDAVCDEKKDVQFEAVEVDKVLRLMVSFDQESLHMLVLDACRNNPFRSWSRGGESGLASMRPPSGTLIAYATSPGSFASDGTGENGLYTNELIRQLQKSQRIEDVFINTRVEVEKKSNGQQSPWELARLRGKYYLK